MLQLVGCGIVLARSVECSGHIGRWRVWPKQVALPGLRAEVERTEVGKPRFPRLLL